MELPFNFPFGAAPRWGAARFEATPTEAQPFCAFVVLAPTELPAGTTITECLVTPEGPGRASRVEMTIAGGARRLHLVQFCYDWWRPTASDTNLKRLRGVSRTGIHALFWGRDSQGRAAACTTIATTQVELTVLRGTFVELELSRLVAGLAAQSAAVAALTEVPFYQSSFHIRAGAGPDGIDELAAAQWSHDPGALQGVAPVLSPDPLPPGWAFDCGAIWPEPPPHQVQWLVREATPFGPSIVLYARARPLEGPQPLRLPPVAPAESGWRLRAQRLPRRGRGRSWFGHQSRELGGWMAAWEAPEHGAAYQLFVRAGTLPDQRAALELIGSLRPIPGVGG